MVGCQSAGDTAVGAGGCHAVDRGGGRFRLQTHGFKRLLLSRVGRLLGHVRFIQELNAKRLADLLGEMLFITMG